MADGTSSWTSTVTGSRGSSWFASGIQVSSLDQTCHLCIYIFSPVEKLWKLKIINSHCDQHGHGGTYASFPAGVTLGE